ncbi:iron-siderophore ABC transporter substrate-binding protein [Kineosporia sp. J2-2]|uniref:Iron-siderophore ABC transporter substrate-binding protein n=1 Tax=Kineosporia corallincola TaxID=2835133 RepID=A0ABS5TK86_9ACTN|nr:iron-siderophore ABC transporter substrate-binding protein [Kineosporia corallincola]MBT0771514.1 iron-siderophore ABC transporter substrate-binding protein [Kineosporia corallincola]
MINRTSLRPFLAVSCVVSAVLVLGACSSSSSSSPSSGSTGGASASAGYVTPRTMPEGKGSGEDDGVFPRTVVHFEGETTLDAEPERVVVISTGQADALLTLGVVPVGSTAGDGAEMIPQYLEDAYPDDDLGTVASVGDRLSPDLESVANLKPDLILMNIAGKDAAALYAGLNEIAPTVATQGTGLYWKQDFLLLSDAVGLRQKAEAWLDDYQTEAATFGQGLDDPGNVSFLRLNEDRTRVFGVASFSGSVAEDIGLTRPESQSFTDDTSLDISAEQLDLADGDHLFYGVQGGDAGRLTGLPLWDSLAVVQAGDAVQVDDDTFYLNTGPTAARGILTVLEDTLG